MCRALVVLNAINDFAPGGPLASPDSLDAALGIGMLMTVVDARVVTKVAVRDEHPENHLSFITMHPGAKIGDTWLDRHAQSQRIFAVHGVKGSSGDDFLPGIDEGQFTRIFGKGTEPDLDGLSAFSAPDFEAHLRELGATTLTLVGGVFSIGLFATAMEAIEKGFAVEIVMVLTFDLPTVTESSRYKLESELSGRGVRFLNLADLLL